MRGIWKRGLALALAACLTLSVPAGAAAAAGADGDVRAIVITGWGNEALTQAPGESWVTGTQTVTVTAEGDGAAAPTIQLYRIEGDAAPVEAANPLTLTGTARYAVKAVVRDAAGNETVETRYLNLDNTDVTAPAVSIGGQSVTPGAAVLVEEVTVAFTPGKGSPERYTYIFNGVTTANVPLTEESKTLKLKPVNGRNSLVVTVEDAVGHTKTADLTFTADTETTVAAPVLDPHQGDNGRLGKWTDRDLTLVLPALVQSEDKPLRYAYRAKGAEDWTELSGERLTLSAPEGGSLEETYELVAVKTVAGVELVSPATQLTARIDKGMPQVSERLGVSTAEPTNRDVRVYFVAADAVSGIASVEAVRGGETAIPCQSDGSGVYTFTADTNGNYTVTVTDHAGNAVTRRVVIVNIDRLAPTLAVDPQVDLARWYGATEFSAMSDDLDAAISVNGEAVTGGKFIADHAGTYVVKAVDPAGNETAVTVTIQVDLDIDVFAARAGELLPRLEAVSGELEAVLGDSAATQETLQAAADRGETLAGELKALLDMAQANGHIADSSAGAVFLPQLESGYQTVKPAAAQAAQRADYHAAMTQRLESVNAVIAAKGPTWEDVVRALEVYALLDDTYAGLVVTQEELAALADAAHQAQGAVELLPAEDSLAMEKAAQAYNALSPLAKALLHDKESVVFDAYLDTLKHLIYWDSHNGVSVEDLREKAPVALEPGQAVTVYLSAETGEPGEAQPLAQQGVDATLKALRAVNARTELAACYDLQLLSRIGDEPPVALRPKAALTVKIPLDDRLETGSVRLYHIALDGAAAPVTIRIAAGREGNYAAFETETFGYFAVFARRRISTKPSGGGGGGGGWLPTAGKTDPAVTDFKDVTAGDWFYDAVKTVLEKGLMTGTDQTHFSPGVTTSRGMIATVLWRLEGQPKAKAGAAGFPDVAEGSWYAQAVAWCAGEGLVTGYDNGTFAPADSITREQMAVVLHRYNAWKTGGDATIEGDLDAFADATGVAPWACRGMAWAVTKGIVTGKPGGRLDPQGTASRAECAIMLTRLMEL